MARFTEPTILEQRSFGRLRWLALQAPELARGVRAGQYVLVRCADPQSFDPLLRRALFVAAADSTAGTVTLLYTPDERGTAWLAERRPGMALDVCGPLGTPFALDPRTHNLLLAGTGAGLGSLLLLASQAITRHVAVVLLVAAATPDALPPPFLLPLDVEYRGTREGEAALFSPIETQADNGADISQSLTSSLITWADQICATLPVPLLPRLVDAVQAARLRWPRGFVQVALPGALPCGTGACQACLIETRRGTRTRCKDGPVFDLRDLRP